MTFTPPHPTPSVQGRNVTMALVLLAAACGGDGPGSSGSSGVPGESAASLGGEVLVSAAASLTDAFGAMESAFEGAHPGVDVILNLAGSSTLREQILEGAPVDVFASADLETMAAVVEAGETAAEPVVFTRNRLQIAVPDGNPADVTGLADFAREELLIGLCAEAVPCGGFARESLERAGVAPAVDTNEPDVRSLLTKIELGEIDAGITYATDVVAAEGSVEGIDLPESADVVAEYPVAVLARAPNAEGAIAFFEFVLSDEGQAILRRFGFR